MPVFQTHHRTALHCLLLYCNTCTAMTCNDLANSHNAHHCSSLHCPELFERSLNYWQEEVFSGRRGPGGELSFKASSKVLAVAARSLATITSYWVACSHSEPFISACMVAPDQNCLREAIPIKNLLPFGIFPNGLDPPPLYFWNHLRNLFKTLFYMN